MSLSNLGIDSFFREFYTCAEGSLPFSKGYELYLRNEKATGKNNIFEPKQIYLNKKIIASYLTTFIDS